MSAQAWLVYLDGEERIEVPIPVPVVNYDEMAAVVADKIRRINGKALWQTCLDQADMTEDPVDLFLEAIAAYIEA